jgi:hypothetical protein
MSYQTIDALTWDALFGGRVRACSTQEAETYVNDGRPNMVAAATDALRGGSITSNTLTRLLASAPGFADAAETESGIDSSQIPDADILAGVQANYPTVAALYWAEDGTPLPGTGA